MMAMAEAAPLPRSCPLQPSDTAGACPVYHAKNKVHQRKNSTGSSGSNSLSEDEVKEIKTVIKRSNQRFQYYSADDCNGEYYGEAFRKEQQELIRRRSASVLEVKEHAHTRLREELLRAQEELKLKAEECKKLSRVQEQMGNELEDLTASLFEEANKMVQDANIKRMQAEKHLKEANSKIEVLQAEVTALKELVMTSTPSMPNRHLHPQIDSKKVEFVKGHRRSTSHHNFTRDVQLQEVLPVQVVAPPQDTREVDPVCLKEFREWKDNSSLDKSGVFLSHIMQEDIKPCLNFTNKDLSDAVLESVTNNALTIEPVPDRNPFPRTCALTQTSRVCKYRIRFRDCDPYHFISQLARNRIIAVCDFFSYIRYINQGLVKTPDNAVYWEIMRLRKEMGLARLGLS